MTTLRLTFLVSIAALLIVALAPNAAVPRAEAAPGTTAYIYCYSEPGGGLDFYYSDVFTLDVGGHMTARGFVPDSVAMKKVLDAFSAYLTQKGYKFYHASFEADLDEAQAKALKHRRAYEGNPCSNCGKVGETGWRYTGQ